MISWLAPEKWLYLAQFFCKNTQSTSADDQQSAEQNTSAIAWRSEQPNLRYLPSKSKNSHFCPSGTENCVFGQQSRRFGQNVSRTKFLQYVQEAVCQFSAKSVGNFSKSSKFTPQLPSINAPPFFLQRSHIGPYPSSRHYFFGKARPPRERQRGIWHFAIFSTKGGRPRPPTVGERGPKSFHFFGFSLVFRRSSEFRRCLIKKTVSTNNKLVFIFVGPLWGNFVGIKIVQNVNFARGWKKVFRTDCFRWPEGPAETIQYALRTVKGETDTQFRSKEALLGWLTKRVE